MSPPDISARSSLIAGSLSANRPTSTMRRIRADGVSVADVEAATDAPVEPAVADLAAGGAPS